MAALEGKWSTTFDVKSFDKAKQIHNRQEIAWYQFVWIGPSKIAGKVCLFVQGTPTNPANPEGIFFDIAGDEKWYDAKDVFAAAANGTLKIWAIYPKKIGLVGDDRPFEG